MKYVITIRGEHEPWLEFVHKAKKEKKKVWEVLSPFLRKYTDSDQENRVLLLHFPRELANELLKKENPDRFIEESIRKNIAPKK